MKEHREDKPCCNFHPKEVIVGVCPLCLNERLLILASEQEHLSQTKGTTRRTQSVIDRKPSMINLPKIFALGSFLNRLEFRHKKFVDLDVDDAYSSQEDSFISIKFEDNGVAAWEKNTVSKVSLEYCNMPWNHSLSKEVNEKKSVVEHAKPRASLRWRKRVGHLFQLMRWKRSSKGNARHVSSKLEGVKVRNGWIRSLTKRRTKE